VRSIAQHLPDDLRACLDPDAPGIRLLASSWYPARLAHLILDALSEGLTEQQIQTMSRDATRDIVKRGTSSIYGFVLRRLITPEMYALSVARLWRQWHDTGDREVRVTSATTAQSKVLRWGGHHPVLCTITIETMCAVFEAMGCKSVTWQRTACVARGAKECATLLEWK